jgi:hypothetical protein
MRWNKSSVPGVSLLLRSEKNHESCCGFGEPESVHIAPSRSQATQYRGDASYQMISVFFGGAQPISTDRFAKKFYPPHTRLNILVDSVDYLAHHVSHTENFAWILVLQ